MVVRHEAGERTPAGGCTSGTPVSSAALAVTTVTPPWPPRRRRFHACTASAARSATMMSPNTKATTPSVESPRSSPCGGGACAARVEAARMSATSGLAVAASLSAPACRPVLGGILPSWISSRTNYPGKYELFYKVSPDRPTLMQTIAPVSSVGSEVASPDWLLGLDPNQELSRCVKSRELKP